MPPPIPPHEFLLRPLRPSQWLHMGLTLSSLLTLSSASNVPTWGKLLMWSVCAVGLAVFAVRILRKVGLRIDGDGIERLWPGRVRLAWSEIESIRYLRESRGTFLVVERTAAARAARPVSRWRRRFARRLGVQDLAIPLLDLRDDPRRVAEVLRLALRIARPDLAVDALANGNETGAAPTVASAGSRGTA